MKREGGREGMGMVEEKVPLRVVKKELGEALQARRRDKRRERRRDREASEVEMLAAGLGRLSLEDEYDSKRASNFTC